MGTQPNVNHYKCFSEKLRVQVPVNYLSDKFEAGQINEYCTDL